MNAIELFFLLLTGGGFSILGAWRAGGALGVIVLTPIALLIAFFGWKGVYDYVNAHPVREAVPPIHEFGDEQRQADTADRQHQAARQNARIPEAFSSSQDQNRDVEIGQAGTADAALQAEDSPPLVVRRRLDSNRASISAYNVGELSSLQSGIINKIDSPSNYTITLQVEEGSIMLLAGNSPRLVCSEGDRFRVWWAINPDSWSLISRSWTSGVRVVRVEEGGFTRAQTTCLSPG